MLCTQVEIERLRRRVKDETKARAKAEERVIEVCTENLMKYKKVRFLTDIVDRFHLNQWLFVNLHQKYQDVLESWKSY